jgi:hypothetical protein
MSNDTKDKLAFFDSFDFTPRLPCPFCQALMNVGRLSTNMYTEHRASHSCRNPECMLNPYNRYSYSYNETLNEFIGASIVLPLDGDIYHLMINKEYGETWLEKLRQGTGKLSDTPYWIPVSLIEIDQYIQFDPAQPVESGSKIIKRLWALRAYY